MAGKITLLDVSTQERNVKVEEAISVRDLLEEAGIDLSKSEDVTLRLLGQPGKLTMDTMVDPGSSILLTRNISGG